MTADRIRLEAVVRGHVQGVGFRDWVRRRARDRGVVGSAVNLPDGGVALVAEGPREAVQSLLDTLRSGPTPGEVVGISADWSPATGVEGFRTG
ncbi:MAG TPA: acylphosphatase [Jatrophihabitans sp.]|uniref:acylphosphatase n=1 Tax=Jatrophihabitans sp. TaxID=1932789 RepID=UPI002DF837C8|nr:acylphosphatase [Jatrophihabitans sp.]